MNMQEASFLAWQQYFSSEEDCLVYLFSWLGERQYIGPCIKDALIGGKQKGKQGRGASGKTSVMIACDSCEEKSRVYHYAKAQLISTAFILTANSLQRLSKFVCCCGSIITIFFHCFFVFHHEKDRGFYTQGVERVIDAFTGFSSLNT
ncbi:hypothetical protein CXF95_00035 [Paraglaciecola sp. MB-3u-78]|jgi:hypothetical protein|nr:hypothetical protein CXF95_00035 [Paraglaciecola sp. MB-3u-78]